MGDFSTVEQKKERGRYDRKRGIGSGTGETVTASTKTSKVSIGGDGVNMWSSPCGHHRTIPDNVGKLSIHSIPGVTCSWRFFYGRKKKKERGRYGGKRGIGSGTGETATASTKTSKVSSGGDDVNMWSSGHAAIIAS